jgi:hypothetical protein
MPCLGQHRSTPFCVTFDVTASMHRAAATASETADFESADNTSGDAVNQPCMYRMASSLDRIGCGTVRSRQVKSSANAGH